MLVQRRLAGEPLAWITGRTVFCGLTVGVDPGVYVPRPQSELLAWRAAADLPANGTAIEVCTGCGAIAAVLRRERPGARVLATDVDPRAVACARANGVEALEGDLFAPLPPLQADVVVGVVPYVPTGELRLLQRDTLAFETPLPYDGGRDGTHVLRRAIAAAPERLRPGGALLLELGAGQPELLAADLAAHGFAAAETIRDEDRDVRGLRVLLLR